jgi:hypothetical protein
MATSSPQFAASSSVWSLENDRCAYLGLASGRQAEARPYLGVDQRLKERYIDDSVLVVRAQLT